MTRRFISLTVVLLVALAGCSSTTASDPQPLPAETTQTVTQDLSTALTRNNVPGGVVAICAPGYQDWSSAAGVATVKQADVKQDTPMTTDLVWPLRSVTKSLTVTLLLQVADEGKVNLDDPISDYVDGVPNGDKITLRQLADMTSGVPEYTTQAWIDDYTADPQREFTTKELIGYALQEPAQFPPGQKAVYTNTSTLLLGEVVAEVTGQPFDVVVQQKLLEPLGMSNTRYLTTADDWSGPHPTGYQPDQDKTATMVAQPNNFTVFGPAGAMTSTLPDLCRWGSALGSGELLKPETQAARTAGQPLDKGPEYDEYAQGIGSLEGWIGHTGEGFGHTLAVMHNPTSGITSVIAMNASGLKKHVPTRLFRTIAPTLDAIPPAP